MHTATKRCIAALLLLLLLPFGVLQTAAADLPEPPQNSCVYDPAGVIGEETTQLIDKNSQALYALSGAQIMVVAVEKTGYSDLSEYANDLFNHWGIGDADENNGVLFVMETSTFKYWAALGYGLEDKITSTVLQRIFDSGMETAFDNEEYDSAAKIFCQEMTSTLEQIYDIDVSSWDGVTFHYGSADNSGPAGGSTSTSKQTSVIATIFTGIIGLLITIAVIVVVIFALVRSSCCACGGPGYYGGPRYRRPFWGGYHHHHSPGPGPGPNPRPGPQPGRFGGGGRTGGFGGGRGGGGGTRPGGGGRR